MSADVVRAALDRLPELTQFVFEAVFLSLSGCSHSLELESTEQYAYNSTCMNSIFNLTRMHRRRASLLTQIQIAEDCGMTSHLAAAYDLLKSEIRRHQGDESQQSQESSADSAVNLESHVSPAMVCLLALFASSLMPTRYHVCRNFMHV